MISGTRRCRGSGLGESDGTARGGTAPRGPVSGRHRHGDEVESQTAQRLHLGAQLLPRDVGAYVEHERTVEVGDHVEQSVDRGDARGKGDAVLRCRLDHVAQTAGLAAQLDLPGGQHPDSAGVRQVREPALEVARTAQLGEAGGDAGRTQAKGSVQEIFVNAERMAADLESDVLWLSEGGDRIPPRLCVAPLQVWGQMRDKLLTDKTVIFTSATLMLGGDFAAVATNVGLKPSERVLGDDATPGGEALPWRGIDVGSPFDYGQQAILYLARHLPPPGRDGLGQAQLDEIVELVDAAGGRTLGLFSSRRAAEAAAEVVRERLPHLTTLAQGDAQLPELAKQFVSDPHTCLFGTLSLWQGLDVPGDTCQLVLIDRIPFPRPDDPLMSARQKAADKAGGNGFMQVAATHAALLLAQGAGRLIRTTTDRGVVAVLDPRLATARYGSFLKASLPPMWTTTDPAIVRKALARLAETAR